MCTLRGNAIGMIFQEPMTALNPVQTIGNQVAETLIIHGRAKKAEALKIAREKLNRVGLTEEQFPLDKYPHELSGGQRQRVANALAIAMRPKILIADEPTTALDVTTQSQILRLLKSLVEEEKMALILITHDLAVVSGLADNIAVMQTGTIVEAGTTHDVFSEMKHAYTRQLFSASNHTPVRNPQLEEPPLVEIKNVVRNYKLPRESIFARPKFFHAVRDISFILRKGENLGLVGESGCGKSTLTRAILGLEELQGGEIILEGDIVKAGKKLNSKIRRKMQVVFQDPFSSFNPRHKIGRLISEPFYLMEDRPTGAKLKNEINDALTNVGLKVEDADKYIHEFSGGQRQRICIARALAADPEIIICDEPTSALDVSVQAQILNLLREIQHEFGLSYLFITHNISVVNYLAHRVAVMYLGRIVEQGSRDEVLHSPKHPYTQALLAAVPELDINKKVLRLEGELPSPANPPTGCHFHQRCPKVMPECLVAYPARTVLSATHDVRCFLYEENN
jgi:peptide/nickel transport system ATP-binding protein